MPDAPASPVEPVALAGLVRELIAAVGDPSRAPAMTAYMRSAMPHRGVTAVPLRALLLDVYDSQRLADREAWEDSPFSRDFFVRRRSGGRLRQHARVDPTWVRALVHEHHARLSGLSRSEALKHL